MANLDRVANVQIALNTTGISAEGFSTLLIVGIHDIKPTAVLSYTSVDDMISDGFKADDALYLAAADAFAQTPRPSVVKIGRIAPQSYIITADEVEQGGTYSITVNSTNGARVYAFEPTEHTSVTPEAVLSGIAAKVTADDTAAVTAEASASALTLTVKDKPVTVKGTGLTVSIGGTQSIAEAMASITASDGDFYGVALTSRNQSDILAMADWTEAHEKIFGTAVSEVNAYNADATDDTLSKLKAGNYYRTFAFYHADADKDFPECAVMARCFAIEPGGETWALKKLAAVTVDNLNETQYNAIKVKNGNTFERFRNVSITQNGKTAAGEWIDVIRFRDWLTEEIRLNVFNVLINNDKVPYTDGGIALIESQVRAALLKGQRRGGIAPTEYTDDGDTNLGFTVSVPRASEISANTKASRILEDVRFTARLAGAIHVVKVEGSLTYDNLIA